METSAKMEVKRAERREKTVKSEKKIGNLIEHRGGRL